MPAVLAFFHPPHTHLLPPSVKGYMLADSGDMATEPDETNNLICINCYAPSRLPGVIIRFSRGTPMEEFFPAAYWDAARKLTAEYDRVYEVLERFEPSLDYKASAPDFPQQ